MPPNDVQVWYESANIPADFPTHENIVLACEESGYNFNGVCVNKQFWVKYGDAALMRGEGRTQAHVARSVNTNPASVVRVPDVHLVFSRRGMGYIVMDFVQGKTLAQLKAISGKRDKAHVDGAAAAYRQLIEIKMPAGTAPGPVGGGFIGHNIFVDGLSDLAYPSVRHLEMQLNNVLRSIGIDLRVNFKSETKDGLVLCPADPNDSNFMIDDAEGKMWAIDFGHACFLPPSFVWYSLTRTSQVFIQRLARRVNYPPSDNVRAMSIASGRLIIFNDNTLGAVVKRSTLPKAPLMAASNPTED